MSPPAPSQCQVAGCNYKTKENLPTHEAVHNDLHLHVQMVHILSTSATPPNAARMRWKPLEGYKQAAVDSSDEVRDQLENLMEMKEEKLKEINIKEGKVEFCDAKLMELCTNKDELEVYATKDEQGFCAIKGQVEEFCATKVEQGEVSKSGGLDPGEGGYQIGAKDWMGVNEARGTGEADKVSDSGGLDPGEGSAKDKLEEIGAKGFNNYSSWFFYEASSTIYGGSSMHTMVMTTIVFNTKGPTIFPWELCQLLTGWTRCLQLGLRAVKMGLSLKYRLHMLHTSWSRTLNKQLKYTGLANLLVLAP